MDRRLLFSISGSNIFKPGRHHSHHGVFAAVLLLLGGIETNPDWLHNQILYHLKLNAGRFLLDA